jgi:hypothetical protein
MVRSSVRPIVRSFVRSFVQIIFFLPLCYRNSDRSFVRSFMVRSSVRPFVRPNSLFPAVMLPKFRSFVRSFDRSSFVHSSYSSFIVRSYELFTITIHHYYSSVLFIADPITPNFNYSSIILSSPPKISQTHILVIGTPVTVIFIPIGNFPSGHPS